MSQSQSDPLKGGYNKGGPRQQNKRSLPKYNEEQFEDMMN
jgi:hypothetical protein